MYFYGIPVILLQVFCAVHVLRTGRPYWWLFVIFLAPVVGSLVYLIVEALPDLRHGGKRVTDRIAKAVDPARDVRHRKDRLAIAETTENKVKLAAEYLESGAFDDAIEMYQACLTGMYKSDPNIMLGLARAQYQKELFSDACETLDRLIRTNPDFKSAEGHMMYAVSLEKLGDTAAALEEYATLAKYYSGLEAKARYALLLKQTGDAEAARELFDEIVRNAKNYKKFYKKEELKWVDVARANLDKQVPTNRVL
jgi:hypothetical protein